MRTTTSHGFRLGTLGAALFLACGLAAPVAAQLPPRDPGMLRMELERTDEMLQRTAEVVRESGNLRAAADLQLAVQSQERAWEHFRAMNYPLAHHATLAARDLAGRALRLAQQQGSLEEHARRVVEDARLKLERARECAGDPPSEPAQRVLQIAAARLEQATEALQQMHYQVALDVASQVHRMLDELCSRRPGQGVEMLIENVRHLLERAAQDADRCPEDSRTLLDRGRELLQRATERLDAGQPLAAAQLAQQAKEIVLRAMRRCERNPESTDVERLLADASAAFETLAPEIRDRGSAAAIALLDGAALHLERARALVTSNDLRAALAEIRVARNLLSRAARVAGIQMR